MWFVIEGYTECCCWQLDEASLNLAVLSFFPFVIVNGSDGIGLLDRDRKRR